MLSRLIIAVVFGVLVTIVLSVIGSLMTTLGVDWATTLGNDMVHFSGILGLLAALWYGFAGYTYWPKNRL